MHHFLEMPPFLGMMTGLGVLKSYGYFLRRKELDEWTEIPALDGENAVNRSALFKPAVKPFDVFISMKRVEWDTLMFFYGIMLCVGGLGALGYLATLSDVLYGDLGATTANILVGVLSAVIDNIPVMFAVLSMNPGYEPRPMAFGDVDSRCRRIAVVHRVGSGRGPHGAGTGDLYVLCPPKMDMGYCLGLCRKYRRSYRDEWSPLSSIECGKWVTRCTSTCRLKAYQNRGKELVTILWT